MHRSQLIKPVSSHLGDFSTAWQKALQHFQRALLECGSTLELEHSQRLGLLFSKDVGSSSELKRWSSLFTAEDIPTCSLFLKALVYHGQWETAVQMLEQNTPHKMSGDLSECLAQFLIVNNLWEQSLNVLEQIQNPKIQDEDATDAVRPALSYENSISTSFVDDSKEMATNARFIPKEEQPVYCGIGATAFRAFPKNDDWQKALALIDKCMHAVGPDVRMKLLEYKAARFVYGGGKTKEFLLWSHENRSIFSKSQPLCRILFYCALENNDLATCLNCFEAAPAGQLNFISSQRLCKFVIQFVNHYKENCPLRELNCFRQVLLANCSAVTSHIIKDKVVMFFKENGMSFSFESYQSISSTAFLTVEHTYSALNQQSKEEVHTVSITEIDKLASALLRQNKWKEALMCLENIDTVLPQNENEKSSKVICCTILQTGRRPFFSFVGFVVFFSLHPHF
ncbi:hypothetical protein STCU_08336 [Strigomonas culicis]|uniref:Uncharacterized protein n=1 Tax=Strigomonas culicis TaxID=28005 RepID=S9V5E9_9TRYP|nr:hypothetical protein STCU_08336 [Strigomonas culicis]|eukprot:EPY22126.1 hypothetical protein STCU_08336 [Strigomonas culicis]